MSKPTDRVRIWNTFFKLTWNEAKSLFEATTGRESSKQFDPLGGTLDEQDFHTLATLVLCNLAIEARANHLIEELVEKKEITREVGDAAQRLNTKHKWFLLPCLARVSVSLKSDCGPHQSIVQICALRNSLMHVNFAHLQKTLPTADTTLSLFSRFVEAMEDMNVVLGRVPKARDEVLERGKF